MCGDRRVPQEPMPHLWGGELLNQLNRLGCGKDEIETARESIANIATPSLSTLALALRPGDAREVGEGVTCTTLHGSKGREFDHVIMAACEDSMVPGTRKCTDVEEERRLFFVGLTRARRSVDVTWSVIRAREYGDPFTEHQPSRFIAQAVI
jgi:superfamily I DNA/RNA helicase